MRLRIGKKELHVVEPFAKIVRYKQLGFVPILLAAIHFELTFELPCAFMGIAKTLLYKPTITIIKIIIIIINIRSKTVVLAAILFPAAILFWGWLGEE